jgi:hypothetical protein
MRIWASVFLIKRPTILSIKTDSRHKKGTWGKLCDLEGFLGASIRYLSSRVEISSGNQPVLLC